MRIQKKIHNMVWKAKRAYDDMVRTNTLSAENLETILSSLAEMEVPIEQKKYRVPGTTPIFVFNLCFYHDDYYKSRKAINGVIPVYQASGTFFPNHEVPLYEVTPIFIPENIIRMANTEKAQASVKNDAEKPKKVQEGVEKKKLPNGTQVDVINVTVLESVESIPPYSFHSSRRFAGPQRFRTHINFE